MTYGAVAQSDSTTHDEDAPAQKALPQNLLGGIALAVIALGCGWTLYANLAGTSHNAIVAGPTVTISTARPAEPAAIRVTPAASAVTATLPIRLVDPARLIAPTFDVALLDRTRSLGAPPAGFSLSVPVRPAQPSVRVVQSVPLPTPRPAGLGSLQATAQQGKAATVVADDPFHKLFGKPEGSGPALAYAAADGGVFNNGQSIASGKLPPNDGLTAIYDIAARTVYLPDGTKLEAHSGLGSKMDDPRYVHVRMHGAMPPHVYDLVPREALFHGVQSLRLIPAGGEGAIFGRTGLLAHTYLLGPKGDSNGCVSFKDYDAFLQAYKSGKVRRMVVVASIDDPQLDLRVVERRPAKIVRTETVSIGTPQLDDRYLPAFSSSLASRTN